MFKAGKKLVCAHFQLIPVLIFFLVDMQPFICKNDIGKPTFNVLNPRLVQTALFRIRAEDK